MFPILLGFVGLVASLFGLVWRGFDSAGTRRRAFKFWLGSAVLFFALFVWALPRLPAPFPS